MKRYIITIAALLGIAAGAQAQAVRGISVSDLRMERNNDYMSVKMVIGLDSLDVKSNRAVLLTPRIVGGNDSVDLHSLGVYGRRRYYYYVRNGQSNITGPTEISYREKNAPDTVVYEDVIPYADWMDGAVLALWREEYGCCADIVDEERDALYRYIGPVEPYMPLMVYVSPKGESVKERAISGKAFIDFPVNLTEIFPDYRNNQVELAKIQATIDPLAKDADITVKSLSIKGYASPESPYSNNTRLAKGRTAALKDYVNTLYNFGEDKFTTSYEPEDWEGLRDFVVKSNIKNRDAILELIDGDRKPDNKEYTIKTRYPEEYKFMLQNWYPALRHSDYTIEYTIRTYTDIEEIKRVYRERPQNLSLQEFYLVAQTMEPGSDDYNEVFETAVRMYPADPVANLNAANNAMQRADLAAAERYLAKTDGMAEATYAHAALAYLKGDYDKAAALLQQTRDAGIAVEEADILLEQIAKVKEKLEMLKRK